MSTQRALVNYADRLEQASRSRHEAIEKAFDARLYSLTSLMGPIGDGPEWPSDASWLALSHGDCALIISDGLSDPWVERDRSDTGLGLEIFVETPDISFTLDAPMAITDTWLFPMTAEVSHTLAGYPRLCDRLLTGEPLSLRFNIEHIKDGRGLAGVLLHRPLQLSELETAMGAIVLVAATLLTVNEMRWLVGRGETGRRDLLAELNRAGVGSRSLLQRPAVIGDQRHG